MSNFFSYLKDEREAREKREQMQREAEAQKAKLAEENRLSEEENERNAVKDAKLNYGEMVKNILQQLRDAAYPRYDVGGTPYMDAAWMIYHDYETEESVGEGVPSWTAHHTDTKVSVKVEFDNNHKPTNFICKRGDKEIKTGLNQDELVRALKKLHPAG